MIQIIPFGYYVGIDHIDYDFKHLRKEKDFTFSTQQAMRLSSPPQNFLDQKIMNGEDFSNKYLRILEKHPRLRDLIEARFNMFMYRIHNFDYKFKITTSWIVQLNDGDQVLPHNHNNCYYSGILYYGEKYPKGSTQLILRNPIEESMRNVFPTVEDNINHMKNDFPVIPETGALYFWASQIVHYSAPHQGEPRYSLPFNFVPTHPLYSGDSSQNLKWITNQNS